MSIENLRNQIDEIDNEMATLFEKRMNIVNEVASTKKNTGKPVYDKRREQAILSRVSSQIDESHAGYVKMLFSNIFSLSRAYQASLMQNANSLTNRIKTAVEATSNQFPVAATVACQGVEGAYSQMAAEKLFRDPNIMYFNSFQAVFQAVEKGLCKYGILPVENSSYGSVTQVYDLMKQHNFYIVKSARLKIDHCLLAPNGAIEGSIREIYSHEQALGQCSSFIEKIPGIKMHICENTAAAAKMVSDMDRTDIAAISSRECASLYGLSVLNDKIQNTDSNFTRFICISRDLEVYPGADKMSLMLSVSHKPGALYDVMARFASLGINLTKIESRPVSGSDFEFMFYFDFDASVYEDSALQLLDELSVSLDVFKFLGSYSEK